MTFNNFEGNGDSVDYQGLRLASTFKLNFVGPKFGIAVLEMRMKS